MIRLTVVTAVLTAAFLVAAAAAAFATRCNWQRFASSRQSAPLDGLVDRIAVHPAVLRPPRRWPSAEDTRTATEALAYAALAEDRADARQLHGELLLLTAGAALGATLPQAVHHTWGVYASGAILLLGAVAHLLRQRVAGYWRPLVEDYTRRHADLAGGDGVDRPV